MLSIDMVDPLTRVTRNSVIEGEEVPTVHEFVAPFIEPDCPHRFCWRRI